MVTGMNGRVGDGDMLDKLALQYAVGITPFNEYSDVTWLLIDDILSDHLMSYGVPCQHYIKEE